jgi:hypothetical protein
VKSEQLTVNSEQLTANSEERLGDWKKRGLGDYETRGLSEWMRKEERNGKRETVKWRTGPRA